MKRLLLLRHAKSAWPEGVADHERPLAGRGEKAAPLMGAYLARTDLVPDLALVSTAVRTQATWALARAHLPSTCPTRNTGSIYEAEAGAILAEIQATPPSVSTLLMVGHNPGLQDLALMLATAGPGDALDRLGEKFPTAALAVIDLDIETWGQAGPRSGSLERFVIPRALR